MTHKNDWWCITHIVVEEFESADFVVVDESKLSVAEFSVTKGKVDVTIEDVTVDDITIDDVVDPESVATVAVVEVEVEGGTLELLVVSGGATELKGTFGKVVVNINDNVLNKKLDV